MQFWKIKREFARLQQQLRAIPEFLTEPILNYHYNKHVIPKLQAEGGTIEYKDRIAIFLIFQPSGIPESVFDTCRHLEAKGYAPFVVSNCQVSESDKEKLKTVTWRFLERRNFGYDFGGYRDGILMLYRWSLSPSFVCIINDSIWFPLYDQDALIETAEAREDVISGTVLRERGSAKFLESYFYLFPKSIFLNKSFRSFWTSFRMTSNKYKVIRRGERGFSQSMMESGLKLEPIFKNETFLKEMRGSSDEFIRETLRHSIMPDQEFSEKRDELLNASRDTWRDEALQFIEATVSKRMPYSAYPYAMTHLMAYPVLKKSNEKISKDWRKAMLTAWQSGELPLPRDVVLDEVRASFR